MTSRSLGNRSMSGWYVTVFGMMLVLTGCRQATAPVPQPAGPVSLVVSGDTQGWLVPCGCTSNQSGGLLRRATYVAQLRQQGAVLLVDAGGAPGGTSAYDVLRFEAILRGEVEMGIRAHNIGTAEAVLGVDQLRELQLKTGVPFVSANLLDSHATHPFAGFQRVLFGDFRVVIIGVTSPKTVGAGLVAVDPKAAILNVLRQIQENGPKTDCVIVLAYLPEQELQELAEQLPEVTAVIGGPTGQAIAPRSVGPTILAAATNKGKFLIEIPLSSPPTESEGQVIELGLTFADHERQTTNMKRFLAELAARDFVPSETSYAPPKSLSGSDDRIAGSASCRDCHAKEHESWTASRHASAWQTLVDKEFHVDPYCQHCHTTGYGRPGGFQSAKQTASLGGVGCESCHGPSDGHAHDPKVRTPWNANDRCVNCHDHENSPHFQFDDYWKQILHGEESSP